MPFFHGGRQKLQNATCYDPYYTYSSRLVHIHTSDHTRTTVTSTTHLTFLKNLTNNVNVGPSRASPTSSVAAHIYLVNTFF